MRRRLTLTLLATTMLGMIACRSEADHTTTIGSGGAGGNQVVVGGASSTGAAGGADDWSGEASLLTDHRPVRATFRWGAP